MPKVKVIATATESVTPMFHVELREFHYVKDGVSNHPLPLVINTDKNLQSTCNEIVHKLHKIQSQRSESGVKRSYVVYVNGEATCLAFGNGYKPLAFGEEYLKEAGVKNLSLKDFESWPVVQATMGALSAAVRYFLVSYVPKETMGTNYKKDAKHYFGVDVSEKSDDVSVHAQATSIMEKSVYMLKALSEASLNENCDDFLITARNNRAFSKQKALELKKQARIANK